MNKLLSILIILLNLLAFSQEKGDFSYSKYKNLDTIVKFQEGINEYSFLWSKKQGFYWDTISHLIDCHHVRFNILNDTEDTIYITQFGGGDGALLYSRINENKYPKYSTLYNSILPNEILRVAVRIYSIERRQKFQKNLSIKYRVNNNIKSFGISSWGYFIKGFERKNTNKSVANTSSQIEQKTKQTNRNGVDSTKISHAQNTPLNATIDDRKQYSNFTKLKVPYVKTQNLYKDSTTIGKELNYYSSKDELIFSKLITSDEKNETYIYKGKKVNQRDSLERKNGLWIYPISAAAYNDFRKLKNAENLYEGIGHLEKYLKGVKIDTQYSYNKAGRLVGIFVWGEANSLPHHIYYFPDGKVSQIDYYSKHPKHKFIRSESIYFSDTNTNCIIKKEKYENQKIKYIYAYKNCELFSKSTVKTKTEPRPNPKTKLEIKEYVETFVAEGKTIKTKRQEIISSPPPVPFNEMPIPYTIEYGEFDPSDNNLINGRIEYYDDIGSLIETKKVLNGLIVQ